MDNTPVLDELQIDYQYHLTKEGEVPFWDHPHTRGYKVIPQTYHPITTLHGVLALHQRMQIKEEDVMLLKVLGDAVCCSEEQLKRYLSSKLTAAQVTKKLRRFRESALVDRWHVRIIGDEDKVTPPSPYTIGIGGYKFLKHYYNDQFYMDPERWDRYGIKAIQRYIATNEFRCRMVEAGILRNWKWHAILNKNPHLTRPLGVAEVETPKGNINFIIERTQMSQNYIGFLREKLELWKRIYEKHQLVPIDKFKHNPTVCIFYTSTYSIAQEVQKELMLDTYPFPIWLCVEEDIYTDGLSKAFYRPDKERLKRIKVDFMDRS
ncbi:hypothetical protein [Alkalihalobacillus sp. BA299]|uniref:hypothetical protein n=1 Tax=Alkalihalobacillus sp. BA299 TaxID=2815938 RepID=UPI001ADCF1E5|nr:hypothetical protein [Alkalihalobacillus sp. BA299]